MSMPNDHKLILNGIFQGFTTHQEANESGTEFNTQIGLMQKVAQHQDDNTDEKSQASENQATQDVKKQEHEARQLAARQEAELMIKNANPRQFGQSEEEWLSLINSIMLDCFNELPKITKTLTVINEESRLKRLEEKHVQNDNVANAQATSTNHNRILSFI